MSECNAKVYCQILGGAIPHDLCFKEQGVKGCRGCDAKTRQCENCGKNQSTRPQFGLCEDCYATAKEADFCENCMRRTKNNGNLCSACHQTAVRLGEREASPGKGRGVKKSRGEVDVFALVESVYSSTGLESGAPRVKPTFHAERRTRPAQLQLIPVERPTEEASKPARPFPSIPKDDCVEAVLEHYGTNLKEALGKRGRGIKGSTPAKRMLAYLLKEGAGMGDRNIAHFLGYSGAPGPYQAHKVMQGKVQSDPALAQEVEAILAKARGCHRLHQMAVVETDEPPEPPFAAPRQEKSLQERWREWFQDPDYSRWYWNTCFLEPKHVLRAMRPLHWKPEPRQWCARCGCRCTASGAETLCGVCKRLTLPFVGSPVVPPSPSLSCDEWIALLLERYCEEAVMGGYEVFLVLNYAEAIPLDPVTIDQYEQDDRIVLLKGRNGTGKRKARHCLVFNTAEDVSDFFTMYEGADFERMFCLF